MPDEEWGTQDTNNISTSDEFDNRKLDAQAEDTMVNSLRRFVDEFYIEGSEITLFEKYALVRNTISELYFFFLICVFLLFMTMVVFVEPESLGDIVLTSNISIPVSLIIIIFFVFIAILPAILNRRVDKKMQNMNISSSEWTHHKIASAIYNHYENNYERCVDDLKKRDLNYVVASERLRRLGKIGNIPVLTEKSNQLIEEYIIAIERSGDIEQALDSTFFAFIHPITIEVSSVDKKSQKEIIDSISIHPDSEVTYTDIVKEIFTFDISLSSRTFRGVMLLTFALIGYGAFTINETLGMLTTVVLYSSFEILSG